MKPTDSKLMAFKPEKKDDAFKNAIYVNDAEGATIGKLIPIGRWFLDDDEKISQMSLWRSRAKRGFLSQGESTADMTRNHLENYAIQDPDRILFALFDDKGAFVGHMGLRMLGDVRGELDNFMRGASGGHPRLIYHAEMALLDWCFFTLGMESCEAGILSYNVLVIQLHMDAGFQEVERRPLKKIDHGENITHEFVSDVATNVNYTYVVMRLNRDQFKRFAQPDMD